jgi:hypothetical protein
MPYNGEPLQLSKEQVREWWTRIELARARRQPELECAEKLRCNYMPAGTDPDNVKSNVHFRNTHLKMAELWAQMPDLHLTPEEPMVGLMDPQTKQPVAPEDVVAVKRAVLNKLLGADGADVDQTVQEALFDIFTTVPIAATKICYESDQPDVQADVPTGQMMPQPGSVLGLSAQIPETAPQMVPGPPVHERWRWYHFSFAKLLRPHDWRSTRFDEAPWLAMEFVEPLNGHTRKKYRLPDDFESNLTRDENVIGPERLEGVGSAKLVKGIEVWLRGYLYDDAVINSQCYRRLVLIEGMKDEAAIYEESPYQTIGQDGKLTFDSMIGNPIHPFTLRVLTDSDAPPPDSAFTDPLVRLKNTWIQQDVKLRDANLPRYLHPDSLTEALEKLKQADVGQGAGIPDDLLRSLGKDLIVVPLPHLERAQTDVQGEQRNDRNIEQTLGLGANQGGGVTDTVRSATEVATVQANVSVRLKGEQNSLMKRWLCGVRKFDALVQRYMTDPGYIEIVGQDGQKRLVPFTQAHLSGRYAYAAKPDTQLSMDPKARVKNATDFTNFMAKSPMLDQLELARLITNEFGYDTARLVKPPQPPPTEKPNISFKGEDTLNPIALALMLKQDGKPLSAQEIQAAQQLILATAQAIAMQPAPMQLEAAAAEAAKNQPHGGAADKADVISKHQSDMSGEMDGRAPAGVPQMGVAH